jgi:murein DD-endopeptidase MepM/ murein hydrolase activator NlpD
VSEQPRIGFDYKPVSPASRRSAHTRWFLSGLLLPLVGGTIAYFIVNRDQELAPPALQADALELEPTALPVEQLTPLVPEPIGQTVEFVVRRNDTLDRIFRQLKLNLTDLASIRELPGVQEQLDRLRPGDTIKLVHDDEGLVQALSRRISDTEVLSVKRIEEMGSGPFAAEVVATPVDIRESRAQGTIDSSLFVAARAAGVSPEIILRLANDIFGWDIDFALDIQPGDRFSVIYEQKYRDGEYIGDGRILAADFVNHGTTHRAIYYESADGKIADYFTPDGRSMRRQFLRAPLDFTRISSNFNPRRKHPILNLIRAHKGVDYAAPTGTIIKAAGDGRVSFVGTKGGYGRVVILEHGGGISTLYGHMSRFARGLNSGDRVKQGTTIGYVGSSGAATGPHLHYEYHVNGAHKNPRTVPLPDAAPIPDTYLAEFKSRSATVLARLDRASDSGVGVIATSN